MNADPNNSPRPIATVRANGNWHENPPQELRENAHALSNFVRHAPVALAMFDRQMRYVAVSRSWRETFGTGDREQVGSSHYDIFPELPDRCRKAHQQALQGAHLSAPEEPWFHADGTIAWHHWEASPWRNEQGEIGGLILFVENVSTPKAIDAVLRLISVESAGLDFAAIARKATHRLAEVLGVEMVQLSIPCADAPGWAETIAVFADGEVAPNYRYALAGTPCEIAAKRRFCLFSEAVTEDFPDDVDLKARGAEAYAGSAMLNAAGELLGVLTVISRAPFRHPEMVRAVTSLAGIGIGGHLESHRARLAVEAGARFNQDLLNTLNSHIAVLDADGKIIFANEAWCAFGRANGVSDKANGVGTNYLEVCDAAIWDAPEAVEAAQLLRDILSGEKHESSFEYPCATAEGTGWYKCTMKRFTDPEQMLVLVAHEEISDIKLARRRSEQMENKFRRMFDNAPDASLIVNDDSIIMLANRQAEQIFGYAPGTLAGLPLQALIQRDSESDPEAIIAGFATQLASSDDGTIWGTVRALRRDGTSFPVEASSSRFFEDDDKNFIISARDVSERIAAEADRMARQLAEQANQAKSIFLATMSHEIRTPLNAVLGFAEVLSHSALDSDQAGLLQHMRASAQHLLGLIDNVLDLSKIEAGEMGLEQEVFDLPALILENTRALSGYAFQRNVRISLFIDPAAPVHVRSDPARLRQVVYNLLGNAIKFSGGRKGAGHVFLRAEMSEGPEPGLRLTVRDDGIGMTDAVRARVFQPFVQGESAITRRFGGTGLGLAITKGIVERLGGHITVDSTPGAGSTFCVTIPLEPLPATGTPVWPRLKGVHCLLAESEAYLPGDLARYLDHEGARVSRIALPGAEGMPASAGEGVDVLVLGPDFPADKALPLSLPRVLLCDRSDPGADSGSDREGEVSEVHPTTGRICLRTELLTCGALAKAVQRAAGISSRRATDPTGTGSASGEARLNTGAGTGTGKTPVFDASRYRPILVVEDDPMNQKVILRQLALLGLKPDLAENGALALEMLPKRPYGLILADLHMPVMDGYAMTTEIRAREARAGIDISRSVSVVALTANALRDEIGRTRKAGFDGFLTKPMTLAQLADTLGAFLTPIDGRH